MNKSLTLSVLINESSSLSELPRAIELLNNHALKGGKQFRSRLLFIIGESVGVKQEKLLPLSILAERVHNATLLHDDVIDESAKRRGKATLNSTGHNKKAILAGDLLLAVGLKDAATTTDPSTLTEILSVLVELVEGEWLQLESRGNWALDERHLRKVAEKKTASLIAWCVYIPARLAGLSERAVQTLRKVGTHLGVAFQMADDCLDFNSSSGKPWGQDLTEGQLNFVTLALCEDYPKLRPELSKLIDGSIEVDPSLEFKEALPSSIEKVRGLIAREVELCRCALTAVPELTKTLQVLDTNIFIPLLKAPQS